MDTKLKENTAKDIISAYETLVTEENHNFISSLAHDLKNPLGIVELSLGLLEDKLEPLLETCDEKMKSKIEQLIENNQIGLDRCKVILDDALTVKRKCTSDAKEEIDLQDFVTRFLIFAKSNIKAKNGQIENDIEGGSSLLVSPQLLGPTFVRFLIYMANNISSDGPIVFKISYNDSFNVEVVPNDGSKVEISMNQSIEAQIFNMQFNTNLKALNAEFSFAQDGRNITAALKLN